ncbi:MAG: glycosyltransferase family 2 protein [Flavobacterium sp.]|nr:glycosyltransferase family 2 protein [Flavobacterium sp.]
MVFFSIIVPLYNKKKYIAKTIQSVLNQTFINFELVIVNDGSDDKSELEVLKFNDSRIYLYQQNNKGVATARNVGIKNAKGNYICFLDADDIWKPDFLQTFKKYIDLVPDQKVFSCQFEIETARTTFVPKYSIKKTNDFEIVNFFKASFKESVLWTSSAAFEKSVFDDVGTFDQNLQNSEDTDLWIRIGLVYEVVFIWKIVSKYCFDNRSISRSLHYGLEEITFNKYKKIEKINSDLKKLLDLNRYSKAIKYKILGNVADYKRYKNQISPRNLSFKKRFILNLPPTLLLLLIVLKTRLTNIGLGNAIFK